MSYPWQKHKNEVEIDITLGYGKKLKCTYCRQNSFNFSKIFVFLSERRNSLALVTSSGLNSALRQWKFQKKSRREFRDVVPLIYFHGDTKCDTIFFEQLSRAITITGENFRYIPCLILEILGNVSNYCLVSK